MRNNAGDWWLPATGLMFPIKIFLANITAAQHSTFNLVDEKNYILKELYKNNDIFNRHFVH